MRRHLSRWHRRVGLVSLFLLGWLAITGIVLNHAEDLNLHKPTGSARIAKWYGLQAVCHSRAWPTAAGLIVDCGSAVYLNGHAIDLRGPVRSAIDWPPFIAVAGTTGLTLFTEHGERVEHIAAELLPGRVQRLGTRDDKLAAATAAGQFQSAAALDSWQSLGDGATAWAQTTAAQPELLADLAQMTAANSLSWTRVVQDLHSGRIIGGFGRALADLGALSILILALLGLVLTRKR